MTLIQRFVTVALVGVLLSAGASWLSLARANDNHAQHGAQHDTASARVMVQHAWVRAPVAGQTATGGFMELQAKENLQLVGVSSDATAVTELHEMAMVNDVMQMRAVAAIALPAGKTVSLKPGSYHVMLMDLPKPLQAGQSVKITLQLKDVKGQTFEQVVTVPVKAMGAVPGIKH